MNQYEHSLIAMKRLLDAVGISHWAKWIETDITNWRLSRDVRHHLSAYGGMGSFNDIWILESNGHSVTREQEPWVNALFEWLKSLCRFLAQHPNDTFDAATLARSVGKHDSALAAFVGGDDPPASVRAFLNERRKLQGWRCVNCGHGEATNRELDDFISNDVVPDLVFRSCERFTLDTLVEHVLSCEISNLLDMRQSLGCVDIHL